MSFIREPLPLKYLQESNTAAPEIINGRPYVTCVSKQKASCVYWHYLFLFCRKGVLQSKCNVTVSANSVPH